MLRRGAASAVEMPDGLSPDAWDSPDVPGAPFPVALAAGFEQVPESSACPAVRMAGAWAWALLDALPGVPVLVALERAVRALAVVLRGVLEFSVPLPDEPALRAPRVAQELWRPRARESSGVVASSPSVSARQSSGSDWLPDVDAPAARRAARASTWLPRGG